MNAPPVLDRRLDERDSLAVDDAGGVHCYVKAPEQVQRSGNHGLAFVGLGDVHMEGLGRFPDVLGHGDGLFFVSIGDENLCATFGHEPR